MPLTLTDAERAMLDALAAPIDKSRQPEFLSAVTTKLEAAGPTAIGPGEPRARCCAISGTRRRTFVRAGLDLEAPATPRAA
jgi:hypothetical protein